MQKLEELLCLVYTDFLSSICLSPFGNFAIFIAEVLSVEKIFSNYNYGAEPSSENVHKGLTHTSPYLCSADSLFFAAPLFSFLSFCSFFSFALIWLGKTLPPTILWWHKSVYHNSLDYTNFASIIYTSLLFICVCVCVCDINANLNCHRPCGNLSYKTSPK